MSFEHFLITRFNLKAKDWKTTKNGSLVLTDSWLKNRFELFENYCFPCVSGQICKNFRWLVFFDTNTPDQYKERIRNLQSTASFFEPIFVENMEAFLPGVREKILLSEADYIITSRLDNDDSVAIDYIEEIQRQFSSQNFEAIDFVDGYILSLRGDKAFFGKKKQLNNPFISLIERKTDTIKSVWYVKHADWKKIDQVKRIYNTPVWFSIIHQENKVNTFDATEVADISKALERFSLDPQLKASLINKTAPPGDWFFTMLKNRARDLDLYYFTLLKMKIRSIFDKK